MTEQPLRRPAAAPTGRSPAVTDLAFVVLTVAAFLALAALLRGVERL